MSSISTPPAPPCHRLRPVVDRIPTSLIREVAHAGMGKEGVIPLWFGEPTVPTPKFICDVASEALAAGDTFYQANRGMPELRAALSDYTNNLYRTSIDEGQVTVTASGMNAVMLAMQCLIDPGDEVVTTAPLWPSLPAVPEILNGVVRTAPLVASNQGWQLDLDRLIGACNERTRVILINSPNNPTGWMMGHDQMRDLLAFARRRGVWIISDEVYARIVFDRAVAPSFLELADPEDRLIVVNSFSKTWAMTGWRLGWIVAPAALGRTLEKLTEFNIAAPPGFVQRAGIEAIYHGKHFVSATVEHYRQARDLVTERLHRMPDLCLSAPDAAFYAFFQVDKMESSIAFAGRLLEMTGIGLAPGAGFGRDYDGYLRLCFAAATPLLETALDRIEDFLQSRRVCQQA
ncbi:MAG: pyridoxal phosphate-dependent aminotransferase [Geminicoccaceae bacterium]